MILSLLIGCNNEGSNGVAELEKKNSFYESVVKIGQGFQEIFGVFENAIGDSLELTVVKSGDKKSVVGQHFEKVKKGLEDTNEKLKELSGKISETKNADRNTIEILKNTIKGANEVFERLISALTKLAGGTNDNSG